MTSKTQTNEAKNTTSQFDSHVKEYYKFKNKDIHHISWKNHGVEQYINIALENYLQEKRTSK